MLFCITIRRPTRSTRTDTRFPYTTILQSRRGDVRRGGMADDGQSGDGRRGLFLRARKNPRRDVLARRERSGQRLARVLQPPQQPYGARRKGDGARRGAARRAGGTIFKRRIQRMINIIGAIVSGLLIGALARRSEEHTSEL